MRRRGSLGRTEKETGLNAESTAEAVVTKPVDKVRMVEATEVEEKEAGSESGGGASALLLWGGRGGTLRRFE